MAGELLFLLLGEGTVRKAQQLREADDGVEGSADLMAHVLDEAGLRGIGQAYLLIRFLELGYPFLILPFCPFQVSHVDPGK